MHSAFVNNLGQNKWPHCPDLFHMARLNFIHWQIINNFEARFVQEPVFSEP
jgi:hypothetical protein